MLDVHPAHHPIRAWRDFFVHIATIVVGLLIAVGLEQLVEHVHQRYELRETREALEREAESNRENLSEDERNWFVTFARLKNNLTVLEYARQHPNVRQTELPGELRWRQAPFLWNHAVWDAAEKNGVVHLMPLEEANRHEEFYGLMNVLSEQSLHDWDAINDAHRFDLTDPDPTHLSPERMDEVIRMTEIATEKHVQFGDSFGRYASEFPKMPHTLTWGVIAQLRPSAGDAKPEEMAAVKRRTDDRINAVLAVRVPVARPAER